MPDISMTDFIDFVFKTGTPKQTKVKQLKERPAYEPQFDFWRKARDGIVDFHRSGKKNKKQLDAILNGLTDKKKINRYPEIIAGYKRFLGRKDIQWFDPPRTDWQHLTLNIKVNPELGLIINGTRHIIKMYFKKEDISKAKTQAVLYLMESSLKSHSKPKDVYCMLKVANGKIVAGEPPLPDMNPLLLGEASSLLAIWNSL